jgi:hypothetical protein
MVNHHAKHCPVTLPPGLWVPRGVSPDEFFGWGSSYGNRGSGAGGLWPHGAIVVGPGFVEQDGSDGMRIKWLGMTSS